ncbi:hypothetical protein VTL71DRAFT_4451 [Oculimacula yallundae]|uniref:Uncharacterized protein n=1 Tax=Oculimacula yallundae TaxID=86028 RepID=A0ABR4C2P1_9HELO
MTIINCPPPEPIDWALIGRQFDITQELKQKTRNELTTDGSIQFDELFRAFIGRDPPSVASMQDSFRHLFGINETLNSQWATFLAHANDTPEACEAAREEFGKILAFPMLHVPPIKSGWTFEEFIHALEKEAFRFMEIYVRGPQGQGKPTRPLLLKFVEGDGKLLEMFNHLFTKRNGDVW